MPRGKRPKKTDMAAAFPETIVVQIAGTPDRPYFSISRDGIDSINTDQIVAVYKRKRISQVRVTRALERLKE